MIEIVAFVCLIANASQCKDVRLTYLSGSSSPRACMRFGQLELAKWAGEHPGWEIRNWSCGLSGKSGKT
ncbi:MAG TPA: hypothetical protein VH852_07175 [Hyphomicrobium sp.]|jgi:hypothetical protein